MSSNDRIDVKQFEAEFVRIVVDGEEGDLIQILAQVQHQFGGEWMLHHLHNQNVGRQFQDYLNKQHRSWFIGYLQRVIQLRGFTSIASFEDWKKSSQYKNVSRSKFFGTGTDEAMNNRLNNIFHSNDFLAFDGSVACE